MSEGAMATRWGLYDTVDYLWLGDDAGPKSFGEDDVMNGRRLGADARTVARIAAEIAAHRWQVPVARIEVRELPASAWRVRDEQPLVDTTLNVLRKIEQGMV